MLIKVFATFTFAGFHQWPGAPDDCAYLRFPHRHLFHVRIEKRVNHDDRDIEFITLKEAGEATVNQVKADGTDTSTWSCERWAIYLMMKLDLEKCEVSEDNENGASVERQTVDDIESIQPIG